YTVSGEWTYDEGSLPEGAVAIEPYGSIHTPTSKNGADMFVVFVGTGPDLLQVLDDEGNVTATTTIKQFKRLYEMTPAEALRAGLMSGQQLDGRDRAGASSAERR